MLNQTQVRLLKITPEGEISTLVEFDAGRLIDVVTDKNRGLFVSDIDEGKIYLVKIDGSYSTFASGFNQPTCMALNKQSELFVTELLLSIGEKVTKIAKDGTKTTVIVYDDDLDINPNGIEFDKHGNLYVVEGWTGEIKKFNLNNTILPIIASSIEPFATLDIWPHGLAIDNKDNLWTLNQNELFNINPSGIVTSIVNTLEGPYNDIGLNKGGDIYFSDYGTGEVFILNKNYSKFK